MGIHKQFLGIRTTHTEGIYTGTLQTSQGKFAVIDREASVAAMCVSDMPKLQIGTEVSATIGKNGLADFTIFLGLSR